MTYEILNTLLWLTAAAGRRLWSGKELPVDALHPG